MTMMIFDEAYFLKFAKHVRKLGLVDVIADVLGECPPNQLVAGLRYIPEVLGVVNTSEAAFKAVKHIVGSHDVQTRSSLQPRLSDCPNASLRATGRSSSAS
jgi:hypothetical protein